MHLSRVTHLRQTIKPPVRTILIASFENEPVELHYPDAMSVVTGLARNPVLVEFFLNRTEEDKQALQSLRGEDMLGLFNRMGPFAVSAIIASAMRNPETKTSYVGNEEVEGWIRDWSPLDQLAVFLVIHEVTNLADFFGLLWSLAETFEIGKQLKAAMKSFFVSSEPAPETPSEANSESRPLPFNPNEIVARPSSSSSEDTPSTPPSDSGSPSADSAEAA